MSLPPKILVAELEVETKELQLEEIDAHEWDLYTKRMHYKQFLRTLNLMVQQLALQ